MNLFNRKIFLFEKITYVFMALFSCSRTFNHIYPNNKFEPLVVVFSLCGFFSLVFAFIEERHATRKVRRAAREEKSAARKEKSAVRKKITKEIVLFYATFFFLLFIIFFSIFQSTFWLAMLLSEIILSVIFYFHIKNKTTKV